MPYLQINPRLRLFYLDENYTSNDVVLLLHGLGANSDSWKYQIDFLTQAGYRVIAPDAPGFGKSTYPGGFCTIPQTASFFTEFLRKLDLPQVQVAGISLGGLYTLQLAIDSPELIERLVLINTFDRLRFQKPGIMLFLTLRVLMVSTTGIESQARYVAWRLFPDPSLEDLRQIFIAQVSQADPRAYRRTMLAIGLFNVENKLHRITQPTLVITGLNDSIVHPDVQGRLVQGIPGALQIKVPNAGHAVIVEQPEIVNTGIIQFLRKPAEIVLS